MSMVIKATIKKVAFITFITHLITFARFSNMFEL